MAPPTVTVNGCTITGKAQPASAKYPKAVDHFYGIPFARASRFQPAVPVPPTPSSAINASRPGPSQPFPFAPHVTAENPLTLNVFRPSRRGVSHSSASVSASTTDDSSPANRLLPVVVYIHGGAFNFGHPLERDMASFVAWAGDGADVVVVSVCYRLGALGFLTGQGDDVKELNLGLRDQRVAVEWVKDWIAPFGGDGADITLMGVSAGAHSIGHHVIHPTPLPFTKAILESGSSTARSILSPTHPRPAKQFQDLKSQVQHASLATLPIDALLEAAVMVWATNAPSVCWPFQPVIDGPGGAVPDSPLELWAQAQRSGRARDMAVITGFCSHEGTQFVPQRASRASEFRSFFAALIPGLSAADLDALEALYPDPVADPSSPYRHDLGPHYGAQFRRLHEAYAHYAYICPVLHTAHELSRAGARVYLYEFAALTEPFKAASHGDQAPVVAHDMDALDGHPGLVAVAGEMNRRWTQFAASPKGQLAEDAWPAFSSPLGDSGGEGKLLVFGQGNDEAASGKRRGTPVQTRTLTESEKAQCRFWWDRMELSQGTGERRAS